MVVAPGLWSCGPWALERGLSSWPMGSGVVARRLWSVVSAVWPVSSGVVAHGLWSMVSAVWPVGSGVVAHGLWSVVSAVWPMGSGVVAHGLWSVVSAVWPVGSGVVARGLWSVVSVVWPVGSGAWSQRCGLWALEHSLSSCGTWSQLLCGMWNLPGPGIKPAFPASAGGFLSTGPP